MESRRCIRQKKALARSFVGPEVWRTEPLEKLGLPVHWQKVLMLEPHEAMTVA